MVWKFFIENIPSWNLILWLVPLSILYSTFTLALSGWFKLKKNWKTGYSRKLFHFSIFSLAGIVQAFHGYPGTIVFGSSVSLVVFYAIYQGDGNILFEAMAREKDAPKRAHYIVMPYLATLFGGVLNNFLFTPEIAICGYMVAGLGDAVAEPIGTKFGKRKYKVPSLKSVTSYRSIEGSTAVLIGSFLALIFSYYLLGLDLNASILLTMAALALFASLVEAVSPHGWDNFTLQVLTGWACSLFLF